MLLDYEACLIKNAKYPLIHGHQNGVDNALPVVGGNNHLLDPAGQGLASHLMLDGVQVQVYKT